METGIMLTVLFSKSYTTLDKMTKLEFWLICIRIYLVQNNDGGELLIHQPNNNQK